MEIVYTIITILLGMIGFWIAEKIILMKKKPEPITCPIGYSCDEVIRGKYSHFFGIPTVNVGRLFYLGISAFFLAGLVIELPRTLTFTVLLIAGLALLCSVYLVLVQLVVIKKWCSWCLFSALINLLIFISVFVGFSSLFVDFLFDYRHLLSWVFTGATLVGTLVTTLHGIIFIKFLKDFEISKKEYGRLQMYSQTAWVAIAFTFLSGLGLVLSDTYREITGNSEFLVMGIIIGILVVYELVHNMIVAPRLIDIHFGDHPELDDEEHGFQRKMAFSSVAVGVVSWYLLMIFSNLSWHEYEPMFLVWLYAGIVLLAVALSLTFERVIYSKSVKNID
jgi:uncharacterized membrane protein